MSAPPFSAIEVWTAVAVASRTVEVNTKTGFSLTAGSYAIHATSNQRGTITLAGADGTEDATISSVTLTRSVCGFPGQTAAADAGDTNYWCRMTLAAATTVTYSRSGTSQQMVGNYEVEETY